MTAYLEDEFERRPGSIGKHIAWLWASVNNTEGRKVVDELFPIRRLAELAQKHGSAAYSNDWEKSVVTSLIDQFGGATASIAEPDKKESEVGDATTA